ncbi:MAG: flagellar basal body rod protein FlgG [Alphaproteobacteria bacterium]|jgi:flagellar basal body rod protein FlgG
MDISNVGGTSSAMTTAVKGAKESEAKFTKAAEEVVKSYAAAANVVSGASSSDKVSPETLTAAQDPIKPMVDMMASKHTYEANIKVFSAVSEMEEALTDILA